MRRVSRAFVALALLSLSCVTRAVREPPTRRIVHLLPAAVATPERHPVDAPLFSDETALLRLDGTRARLYGDPEGVRGWSVRGALLLDIVTASGVLRRVAIGEAAPLPAGVTRLGPPGSDFGPGQIELTEALVLGGDAPFRLRATVIGSAVSDVFLVLEPPRSED